MTLDSKKSAGTREEIQSLLSDAEIARRRIRAVAIVKQELCEASTFERPSYRDQRAVLSFPPFRLDVAEERLWKNGREMRLRPKPFSILRYLAQHPRRLVTKSEIVDAVWGRIAMGESLVRTHVYDLRRVLGEDVIETVVGRGYRFLADVSEIDDERKGKWLAAEPPLELVRTPQSRSPSQAGEVAQAVRADSARILKELSDALATLGIKATVLLIAGDEHGPEGGPGPAGSRAGDLVQVAAVRVITDELERVLREPDPDSQFCLRQRQQRLIP
jgi:DNA-binding winged helix-turn-helix (wHTH) protein